MNLQYFITLFAGMVIGAWAASYAWNRYYRAEIWSARKAVMLERLLVQRKDAERERTKHELAIDKMLDERRANQ